MTNNNDFRKQIKELMEQKEISTSKLSRLIDVHQDTLYHYFRGTSEIGADKIEKIFNVLNLM